MKKLSVRKEPCEARTVDEFLELMSEETRHVFLALLMMGWTRDTGYTGMLFLDPPDNVSAALDANWYIIAGDRYGPREKWTWRDTYLRPETILRIVTALPPEQWREAIMAGDTPDENR